MGITLNEWHISGESLSNAALSLVRAAEVGKKHIVQSVYVSTSPNSAVPWRLNLGTLSPFLWFGPMTFDELGLQLPINTRLEFLSNPGGMGVKIRAVILGMTVE